MVVNIFPTLIENCNYDIIKSMLQNLQHFLWEFVTSPESGDNHFIFKSPFHNTNIGMKGRKKEKCLTPEYYGWPKDLQITVNELYKMQHFIDCKQFKELIRDKRGNINIAESSYLKFKSDAKLSTPKFQTKT